MKILRNLPPAPPLPAACWSCPSCPAARWPTTRDCRAALVGIADLGRGSRGTGLSDSAAVRDRRHGLLGPAAGEHPGPAAGTQRQRPGLGQELPADRPGGYVAAKRLGEVRRPGLPVPGRLRPPRTHAGNHQGPDPGSRRSGPRHHRAPATPAQCRVQRPDLRRWRRRSRAAPRSTTGATSPRSWWPTGTAPRRICRSKTKR